MFKHENPFKCDKSKIENVTFIDAFTVDLLAITVNYKFKNYIKLQI